MDHPLHDLIEAQLAKARQDGAFDNLPGQGKPLTHIKDMADPTQVRLKSEGEAPSLLAVLRDDIAAETAKLAQTTDPDARKRQMQIVTDLKLKLAMELESIKRIG